MKYFDSRIDMLNLINEGGRLCEVGVFRGEFANVIRAVCKPEELVLIDSWEGQVSSGDENGNVTETFDGEYLFNYVQRRFYFYPEVKIIRAVSSIALKDFADDYFDTIYIDGDHSYEGALEDINLSYQKIKKGGFIMGHDYETDSTKTSEHFDFGVKKAVNEFCNINGQSIFAIARDGLQSYAIEARK